MIEDERTRQRHALAHSALQLIAQLDRTKRVDARLHQRCVRIDLTICRVVDLGPLRQTPLWLVDETPQNLCRTRPPFGLLSSASSMMSVAGIKNSSCAITNATCACYLLAEALRQHSERPALASYNACAVVGSGGGLMGSAAGRQIDSHDAVLRFNTAPVERRFDADVGNRSTLWVASHFPWRVQLRTTPSSRVALYCFNPWLGSCHADAVGGKYARRALLRSPLRSSAEQSLRQGR